MMIFHHVKTAQNNPSEILITFNPGQILIQMINDSNLIFICYF
jgi:hypothetical protein